MKTLKKDYITNITCKRRNKNLRKNRLTINIKIILHFSKPQKIIYGHKIYDRRINVFIFG